MKQRLEDRAREWRVAVDETFETATSLIAYGRRDDDPVVLKLVKVQGDEWHSGEVLKAFGGRGMVRVHDFAPGAMLLERRRAAATVWPPPAPYAVNACLTKRRTE
jgi:streptomycin 6-kinase